MSNAVSKYEESELIVIRERSRFIEMLGNAVSAIDKSPQVPILSCVLVEIEENRITMTGSDSTSTIRESDVGVCHFFGGVPTFVAPGHLFLDAMKKLPAGEIEFDVLPDQRLTIQVRTGKKKPVTLVLNLSKVDEYPKYVHQSLNMQLTVKSGLFSTFLKATMYAAEKKESILSGINFEVGGNAIKFVATNRHRLAMVTYGLEDSVEPLNNMVIPMNAAKEMKRLADLNEQDIIIEYSENMVQLKIDHIVYQTKLLSGTYPDTSKIIPPSFTTEIMIKRDELLEAFTRANICSENAITLAIKDKTFLVRVKSDGPQYEEELAIQTKEGKDVVIGADVTYLVDMLKVFSTDQVLLKFNGPLSPIVIKPKNLNDMDSLAIVLPVRITGE